MTDEPTTEELQAMIAKQNVMLQKLADDYTQLRHEVNQLEKKVERRT